MRRYLVLLAIIIQLAVLGYMAGKREIILATGKHISLQTAPIDPRDPFRGDYVRLSYPFNTVSQEVIHVEAKQKLYEKGYQVYAVMKPSINHLYAFDYLTDTKPENQLFIKGRTTSRRWNLGTGAVGVKYGLEQLYVEQGKGSQIERIRGNRSGLQVPMEVQLAVGTDGTAVIRDYQWSKLGMQLEILRFNRGNRRNSRSQDADMPIPELSPKLKITLKNVSNMQLIVVDPGNHCGFKLKPVLNWSITTYTPLDTSCQLVTVSDNSLKILKPDQIYQVELDLGLPRWHMLFKDSQGIIKQGEIGSVDNNQMFRIVYQSPGSEQLSGLSSAPSIWLGTLASRAFNVRGRID
ncbi:MAG TPA: hypothetical protein ENJ32_00195 [Crenotrichaceae bacterium]|nr:hypothetical protein [Crenotrichaceae bacterium]